MAVTRRNFLSSLWPAALLSFPQTHPLTPASVQSGVSEVNSGMAVRLVDVSEQAGLRDKVYYGSEDSWRYILETTGCGIAFYDYDHDGWLDIFVVNGSRLEGFSGTEAPTNHLYRNNRDGTFTDVTKQAGLARSGWGQGVCIGDYNNDGFDDLFVTYWGENVLYRNNGDGTFTDVSQRAGILGKQTRWGTGCAFVDYDRDGYLDLVVANYLVFNPTTAPQPGTGVFCQYMGLGVNCGPGGLPRENAILYHNSRDGSFTEVTERAGLKSSDGYYGLGVLTGDFDNDGWPDIYIAADATPSRLFRNNHSGRFIDVAVLSGCAFSAEGMPQSGMGVAAGDYDCDGWLDIYKTNFSYQLPNLYRNDGDGTFTDRAAQAGMNTNTKLLGWGCGFADFDNDGWPDIFQCNGHVYPEVERLHGDITFKEKRILYRNTRKGNFQDVSSEVGIAGQRYCSRGCAFGDFDNDGDIDVVISNLNDTPSLLRADVRSGYHWIKVRVSGRGSNRSGIGTRVKCVTADHQQIDEVRSGGSFMSQSDLRLHFGLGKSTRAERIEVRWPNGNIDTFRNLDADQLIEIEQGTGITRMVRFKT
jgi:hypothetical protein